MPDFARVRILYTANLRGDLALLARLAVLIHHERQTAEGPVLLLDLGDSCSVDSWICRVTLGRASLMVLDAAGYDAAVVGGPEQAPIPPDSLRHFREQAGMLTPIWGRPASVVKRGVSFAIVTGHLEPPEHGPAICIDRSSSVMPDAGAVGVLLGDVPSGVLARVDLAWPEWTVVEALQMRLPEENLPDPSIAAIVDLVTGEAQYLLEQQGGA